MSNVLTIIIPYYNVEKKEINKCIKSIISQKGVPGIEILLIDDNSTNKYYRQVIEELDTDISIKIIEHNENMGPGKACQTGIENLHTPFFMFMNAWDEFTTPLVCALMLKRIGFSDNFIAVYGDINFLNEENLYKGIINNRLKYNEGIIYKTSFITDNNIQFSTNEENSYVFEDYGFNLQIENSLKNNEKIGRIEYTVINKTNKINDNNNTLNENYFFKTIVSFIDTHQKMIKKVNREKLAIFAFSTMQYAYDLIAYNFEEEDNEMVDEEKETILLYINFLYNLIYKYYENILDEEIIVQLWEFVHPELTGRQYGEYFLNFIDRISSIPNYLEQI